MFKNLFSGGASKKINLEHLSRVKLSYVHSVARQHMDDRPHIALVVLHDYFCSAPSLSKFNGAIAQLPMKGYYPAAPLDIYVPEMRGHGKSAKGKGSTLGGDASMMDHCGDIVHFVEKVIEKDTQVHLVGFGWGAHVAACAALSDSSRFSSLVAVNALPMASTPSLYEGARTRLQVAAANAHAASTTALDATLSKVVKSPAERHALVVEAAPSTSSSGVSWSSDVDRLTKSLDSAFAFPKEITEASEGKPSFGAQTCVVLSTQPSEAEVSAVKSSYFPNAQIVPLGNQFGSLDSVTHQNASQLAFTALSGAGILTQAQ